MQRAAAATPLWTRWALAVVLCASLLAALVIVIVRNPRPDQPTVSAKATLDVNHLGAIVVREDQAPHTAPLTRSVPVVAQLRRAVAADARARIAVQNMTGPLESVSCHPVAFSTRAAGRTSYACDVIAGALSYPFRAVADPSGRTLTWCKQDAVSGPGLSVPLAARCLS